MSNKTHCARFDDLDSPIPTGRFLAHSGYSVFLTAAGTGYSRFHLHALTRWSSDAVEDRAGWFIYLRDLDSGNVWSATRQPASSDIDHYTASWKPGVIEIARRSHEIETTLGVALRADGGGEVRSLAIRNASVRSRRIEITSYLEVVLHAPEADASHPAFSKLFVQTEHHREGRALLARRRPRSQEERHPWMFHAISGDDAYQFETDRMRFLGRGGSYALPRALARRDPLSGTAGNVLDPILALRRTVELAAGAEARVEFFLGAAGSRDAAIALCDGAQAREPFEETARRAVERETASIVRAGLDLAQAEFAQALASAAHFGDHALRERASSVADVKTLEAYWAGHAIPIELSLGSATGGSAARATRATARPIATPSRAPTAGVDASAPRNDPAVGLRFFNGHGGFSEDGTEYVIPLRRESDGTLARPPLPWVNVIANERFGFLVSETGAGYTWSANSREHRLTEWSNDPVLDPHSEAIYIRDDDSGEFWSPLPGPCPANADYEARHGFGYSTFRVTTSGIEHETCLFAHRDAPVKVDRVRLVNRGGRARRLSLFAYRRLVLGVLPEATRASITVTVDADARVLTARNPDAGEFAAGVAFASAAPPHGSTVRASSDRARFIGRFGDVAAPRTLLDRDDLEDAPGDVADPCFAQQVSFTLAAGASTECAFFFGEASDIAKVRSILDELAQPGEVERALRSARDSWRSLVSAMRIETPDAALDILVNGWLPYQNLGCRIWGRSAFYQSGGAFGFRDQLQDSSALVVIAPERTRAQILLHAAHQFVEGDVLHWWHPPRSRGLRTRFADDLLWLPFLTADYVRTTGDAAILDERVGFVTARALEPGEDEAFLAPERADAATDADIYEHCCRAIERSLATGAHGLPLFGAGDWNDAMNRVGREGRGESVWMGFFLHSVLADFLPLCQRRGDDARARRYAQHRDGLAHAINNTSWDGEWYRRAYYDDGTPLGSHESDECQIDALAQAWSVLSRVAPADRAATAMDSVERHLISDREKLIRLLTPPFENTPHDPGYIKGYVPGVRENGGQYTHAALWVVRAMAELGRNNRAAALLSMLCPTSHTRTPSDVDIYKVEPYVVVADVYGAPPHVGRGGWTWYTGSAGWMYRVAIESVLGFRIQGGDTIVVKPCIPDAWPQCRVEYRDPRDGTRYAITIRNTPASASRVASASIDGAPATVSEGAARIPMRRDGGRHQIDVVLG
ncbi:MAG: GH36-type glycosyl hydrolase domain-containing protein [bacterium]